MDFTGGHTTFGYLGSGNFTFTDVSGGIPFNIDAVGVSTQGGSAVTALGLPFYNPPQPTTFFDPIRGSGVLEFGPGAFNQFDSFSTTTAIPYSLTGFIIGLKDVASDGVHYGYGEFGGTTLLSYGFESVAGQAITISGATLSPVPLPASAPMFGAAVLGLGLVGYGLNRKKTAAPA